jgi:hypothetical protein
MNIQNTHSIPSKLNLLKTRLPIETTDDGDKSLYLFQIRNRVCDEGKIDLIVMNLKWAK